MNTLFGSIPASRYPPNEAAFVTQVSSPVVRETASLRNDDFRYFPLLSLADQQVRSSRLPIRQYSRRLALTDDPQKRPISISFDSLAIALRSSNFSFTSLLLSLLIMASRSGTSKLLKQATRSLATVAPNVNKP